MFRKKRVHKLSELRKDFIDNLQRIRPDLEKYHEVAFSKFVYQFHRVLSEILQTDKNLTLDEIVEQLKNLSSTVYSINKTIKQKEDSLLQENDKKRFNQIKKEIDSLKEDKDYYATVEKNAAKHSLVFMLKDISEKVNRLGFSGVKFSKDEAKEVIDKAEDFIRKITHKEPQRKKKKLFSDLLSKFRKPEQESNKAVERQVVPNNFQLSEKEKQYIKQRVGDQYYREHILPVINFIDSMQGRHSIGEIEKIYKNKYWRDGLDEIFKLIYEAMHNTNYADDEQMKEQVIKDAHNFQLTPMEKDFIKRKVNPEFFQNHVQPVIQFIDSLNGNYSLGQIEKAYREQVWRKEFETTFKLLYDIVRQRRQN